MKLQDSYISRRTFLSRLFGGWLAAFAALIGYPLVKFVAPVEAPDPLFVLLPASDYLSIAANSTKTFRWGHKMGIFMKAEDQSLRAFKGTCSHLDCNVTYKPDQRRFFCPCHDGWYDEGGRKYLRASTPAFGPSGGPGKGGKTDRSSAWGSSSAGGSGMSKLQDWLTERVDLGWVEDFMRSKVVPHHRHSYVYYSGGILLLLLGVQIITGTLLLAYYSPGEDTAFESIVNLVTKVPLGVYMRSIHSWSANIMVFFLFFHLFSILFYQGYRRPRELTWVGGFILLVLTLAFGFSGYLLPWNQLAVTATKVGTDSPRALGPIGAWVTLLLRGGEDVTGITLGRFFALHVWGLPLLFFPLLALHLFLVQAQGMAVPPKIERKGEYSYLPFFPNVFYRDLAIWLVTLGLVITLAVVSPWTVGEKADLLAPTPERMKPEWFFLFLFQTLKLFPGNILGISGETVAMSLILLLILAAFFYPWIDRGAGEGKTPFLLRVAPYLALIYVVGMTLWGFLS